MSAFLVIFDGNSELKTKIIALCFMPLIVALSLLWPYFSVESFSPGDQPFFSRLSEYYSHIDYLTENKVSTLTIDEIRDPKKNDQT